MEVRLPQPLLLLLLVFFLLSGTGSLPVELDVEDVKAAASAAASNDSSLRTTANRLWQRTGFHFQPKKNWMNDPNGPMVYKGLYHLFYQYNPYAAVWGNITWAHAVSTDLIRWSYVEPLALVGDQWYDINGAWSGSATLVNGRPVMLYTGWSNVSAQFQVQIQNVAVPKNPNDPLLREWIKPAQNPIATAPPWIDATKFRDPTTGWIGIDGKWRMAIGSKLDAGNTGIILQYKSSEFVEWDLLNATLHSVPGTGMWECPDFYAVDRSSSNGLPNYDDPHAKYVVKVSLDEKRYDVYVVGKYDREREVFEPSVPELDIGSGALRYDYGIYYASKTFYDYEKKRRVLFGWISEADTPAADVAKGWSSVQALPRQIWLDKHGRNSLIQWPVKEVEMLRRNSVTVKNVSLKPGQVVEVHAGDTSRVDIEVSFDSLDEHADDQETTDYESMKRVEGIPVNTLSYCNETFPAAEKVLGPFGLYVLARADLGERTSVFFKLFKFKTGWKTAVCNDLTSSSLASDATKGVYGSLVSVSKAERNSLSLRVLVDHSIVETFAQGGKTCITARSYPLFTGDHTARLFLFNNGSSPVKVKRLNVWHMSRIYINTID